MRRASSDDEDDLSDRDVEGMTKPVVLSDSESTRAIRVTYHGTRDEALRSCTFTLWNQTTHLVMIAFYGICGAAAITLWNVGKDTPPAWVWFPVWHALVFVGILAYSQAILLTAIIRARYPKPDSVRVCTSSLTADGFYDMVPEKLIRLPWSRIRWILEVGGDLHFWTLGRGCYIPRSAFKSRDAARQFYRAALVLWRSRGAEWPEGVPAVFPTVKKKPPEGLAELPEFNVDSSDVWPYSKVVRWCLGILVMEYLILDLAGLVR
jgi:hypothetical protein